ncbi:HNH endonuclease [bacterium]|nr:HNH endonuclease [bacterium]
MRVYVINKNGNPLMPCKPAKARHLLRNGKAKVIKRKPFAIQLLWDCEENIQEVRCGIDKGCKVTGIACAKSNGRLRLTVGNGRILFSANIKHRNPVALQQKDGSTKTFMNVRAERRKGRRNRHCWHRKPRFNNRASSKRSGKLPPTIKMNVMEVVRVVRKIDLLISHIIVEDVQIDVRRLSDPDVKGSEYQQSNRLDENLRIACLIRDNFTCQKCSKKNTQLEAHHIVWVSKSGKDSIYNLITLCESCHDKVHKTGESGKVKKKGGEVFTGMDGFSDQTAQRTMQGKNLMYQELEKIALLSTVYGYQTASFRKACSYEKEHWIDAVCITNLETDEFIPPDKENHYQIWFRAKQTRRIFDTQPTKGGVIKQWQKYKGLASNRKNCVLVDKRDKNFVLPLGYTFYTKGDVISISGLETEIASISGKGKGFYYWIYQPDGNRKYASVSHQKVKLIEYAKTINYI